VPAAPASWDNGVDADKARGRTQAKGNRQNAR